MKKVLFTLLAVSFEENTSYLSYCKNLASELLEFTPHDVLITTNDVEFFDSIENSRLTVRPLTEDNVTLNFNGAFNYNLKFMCFYNIPTEYDLVFYMDCDMKIEGPFGEKWDASSDEFLTSIFDVNGFDSVGPRATVGLRYEMQTFIDNGGGLYKHKLPVYTLDFIQSLSPDIADAKTPSEHFLILKNDTEKIKIVYDVWKMLNSKYENNEMGHSAAHDALEIGISLKLAGYDIQTIPISEHQSLKLKFNGNKI